MLTEVEESLNDEARERVSGQSLPFEHMAQTGGQCNQIKEIKLDDKASVRQVCWSKDMKTMVAQCDNLI